MSDIPARTRRTPSEGTPASGEPGEPVVAPIAHMKERTNSYAQVTPMRIPVYFRRQVREKVRLLEDSSAITPGERLGPVIKVLKDVTFLSYYPWAGRQIEGLSERYRYLVSGHTYIVYCVIENENTSKEKHILLLDIRINSQQPLDKTPLRRYSTAVRQPQAEGKD